MNKKIKFIIPCLVVLITISVSIIISISKEKVMTTNKAVSGIAIYVNNGTSYVSQSSVPTGSYYLNTSLSHCVAKGEINSYNNTTGAVSYSLGGSDRCYLYFDPGTVSMQVGVASEEIINLAKNDSTNLAYDDFGNIRYIGANPNNYVCFDDGAGGCINYDKDDAANKPAGLFRIIGVFNEDTHGVANTQLVKLISADALGDTYIQWDNKWNGIGSSQSNYGDQSNDWSDAQLMYMLNGTASMYSGYNDTTALHTGYSYDSSTYYISDGTYNIYQLYNGLSYLTGNGTTSLNVPAKTTTSTGYIATTNTNMQTLTMAQANMIASVTWHLGGVPYGDIIASDFYTYERGMTVYSSDYTTTRPTTWIGKIGLMYISDWGYATSGGSACLNSDTLYWCYDEYCYENDWLTYRGTRTGTQGTSSELEFTLSVHSDDPEKVWKIYSNAGYARASSVSANYEYVRPSFYLKSDVYIKGGSGTSTDPYRVGEKPTVAGQIVSLASTDSSIIADEHTDSSNNSTYYEYRYVGANPNNYACFDDGSGGCINSDQLSETIAPGALFRIIGVFDEHTHGQSGEQLVKLITADKLSNINTMWDYKLSGVGSSTSEYGSNDWSDSQLMYMLNGSEGNNKGYQSLAPVYGTTTPIRTLTYSNNNVYYDDTNEYYFYTNYNGNSYLSAGDGTTTSSRRLNMPDSVSNGSNYSSLNFTVKSLVSSQTRMIKEVTWHLGGSSGTSKTASHYSYERGTTVSSGHATTWIGKIGLMYLSDYGYATSGGTTYDRNTCLTSYNLGSWDSYSDCYTNDWLFYPGARTGTQGTAINQLTINSNSSNAYIMYIVYSMGGIRGYGANTDYYVRPTFYLESSVYISGGSGTSTDPYRFTM